MLTFGFGRFFIRLCTQCLFQIHTHLCIHDTRPSPLQARHDADISDVTRGPVPEFGEVRQSTVDPDNDVLLRIVDGLQQYFTELLLGVSFPDLCHKTVLRQYRVTSLVFKCAHDSLVGRSPEGEERELSPHLVADCGRLWKQMVSVATSEQMKVVFLCCSPCSPLLV